MSLDTLKKRASKAKSKETLPDWVSSNNASLLAFERIKELKKDKLNFIATHNQISDYKKKGHYQIWGSEVARHLGVATTTLISTSRYSSGLKRYLDDINEELAQAKNRKLETHRRTLSAGLQQRKKDEIKKELQKTREELTILKQRNAREQIEMLLAELPLPIKRKLGLDV